MSSAGPAENALEPFLSPLSGVAEEVRAVVEPVVVAEGCELVKLEVSGGLKHATVRLFVDLAAPGLHIGIGELERLNRLVGDMLDVEDAERNLFRGQWELEVSSPGVDRPLTKRSHFAAAVGEQLKVRARAPVQGRRVLVGTLIHVDDDGFSVQLDDVAEPIRLDFSLVDFAHTIFQFETPDKRGKKSQTKNPDSKTADRKSRDKTEPVGH